MWDNVAYQITGSQPTLTASTVDLVAIAKGAGTQSSACAVDEAHFETLVNLALQGRGPIFIGARTDNQPPTGVTERDANRIRTCFMDAMQGKAV